MGNPEIKPIIPEVKYVEHRVNMFTPDEIIPTNESSKLVYNGVSIADLKWSLNSLSNSIGNKIKNGTQEEKEFYYKFADNINGLINDFVNNNRKDGEKLISGIQFINTKVGDIIARSESANFKSNGGFDLKASIDSLVNIVKAELTPRGGIIEQKNNDTLDRSNQRL